MCLKSKLQDTYSRVINLEARLQDTNKNFTSDCEWMAVNPTRSSSVRPRVSNVSDAPTNKVLATPYLSNGTWANNNASGNYPKNHSGTAPEAK